MDLKKRHGGLAFCVLRGVSKLNFKQARYSFKVNNNNNNGTDDERLIECGVIEHDEIK